MSDPANVSRRDFVAAAGTLAFGAMIVPRRVLGGVGYQAPSDTLNVAIVGAGGMGMSNWSQITGQNVVALCDVDFALVERALAGRLRPRPPGTPPAGMNPDQARAWAAERAAADAAAHTTAERLLADYQKAKRYADFREMLDRERGIDAVVVATPDHLHAVIAERAMRAGKHVYVQKPLTYSVHEARQLARTARETKVVTQMGNQGHSMDGTRRIKEIVAAGVLGPVREVHVWTDRPYRYWAQGIPRPGTPVPPRLPTELALPGGPPLPPAPPSWNVRAIDSAVLAAMASQASPPPPGLRWDLFLGPVPNDIPYHPAYHPFSWRGWVPFGVGAIGDMGAHLIDQPYWALDLDHPTAVSASATPWGGSMSDPASYPAATTAEYEFAAKGARGPVRLFWYDGGLLPPRPPFLPDDVRLGGDGGGVFVGEKGILVYDTYGNNPRVYPESAAEAAARVAQTVPRIAVPHEMNWVMACKGQAEASSPFSYAAALTETMLLPLVALRAGYGRKLRYDGATMTVTNVPEANQYLTREYRQGWVV